MLRNHHASLLVGSREEAESYVSSICSDLKIKIANNPDVVTFRTETFGIEESRQLTLLASRKPLGNKKIFLIIAERLTLEAQNALLKTFEDPTPNTYFFLVTRDAGNIIPTLRSRMQVVYLHIGKTYVGEAEKFLSLPIKERLVFAKKFVDEERNLPAFLDELLLYLRDRKVYDVIISARGSYTSPRIVLEHLALVL